MFYRVCGMVYISLFLVLNFSIPVLLLFFFVSDYDKVI